MNSFTNAYDTTIKMKAVETRYIQFADGVVWRISCNRFGKILFDTIETTENGVDTVRFNVLYQEDIKPEDACNDSV